MIIDKEILTITAVERTGLCFNLIPEEIAAGKTEDLHNIWGFYIDEVSKDHMDIKRKAQLLKVVVKDYENIVQNVQSRKSETVDDTHELMVKLYGASCYVVEENNRRKKAREFLGIK